MRFGGVIVNQVRGMTFALAVVWGCSSGPDTATAADSGTNDSASPDTGVGTDGGADSAPVFDCAHPLLDPEKVTKGTPSWKVAELAVFVAPVGDPSDKGAAAAQSESKVLNPKHVFDVPKDVFKAAYAHPAPYDKELVDGLASSGFTSSGCFKLSELSAPSGIIITVNLVPSASAPTGVSYEEPNVGPIIQFSSLSSDGDLYIDGVLIDPNFDGTYPKAAYLYDYPATQPEGLAHMFLNFGENQPWAAKPLTAGDYRFELRLSDGVSETLDVVHFKVK